MLVSAVSAVSVVSVYDYIIRSRQPHQLRPRSRPSAPQLRSESLQTDLEPVVLWSLVSGWLGDLWKWFLVCSERSYEHFGVHQIHATNNSDSLDRSVPGSKSFSQNEEI